MIFCKDNLGYVILGWFPSSLREICTTIKSPYIIFLPHAFLTSWIFASLLTVPASLASLPYFFFFFKAVSYAWNALLSLFPHCCMTRPTTPSTLFSNVIFSRWPSLTNSFYIETLLQPLEFLIPLIFLYSLFTGIFQELEQCLTFSRSLWNICVFEWTKCWI